MPQKARIAPVFSIPLFSLFFQVLFRKSPPRSRLVSTGEVWCGVSAQAGEQTQARVRRETGQWSRRPAAAARQPRSVLPQGVLLLFHFLSRLPADGPTARRGGERRGGGGGRAGGLPVSLGGTSPYRGLRVRVGSSFSMLLTHLAKGLKEEEQMRRMLQPPPQPQPQNTQELLASVRPRCCGHGRALSRVRPGRGSVRRAAVVEVRPTAAALASGAAATAAAGGGRCRHGGGGRCAAYRG